MMRFGFGGAVGRIGRTSQLIEALEKALVAAWHNKAGIYIGPYDVLRECQGRAGKLRFR